MPRKARSKSIAEKNTTKRGKAGPTAVTARTNALHKRLVESGGRQVSIRLDAESSAVLARLEDATGRSPRAIFVALLQRPDIDRIVAKAVATAADAK
ncbi:hypothetical protein P7L87_26785 [Vibrio parahaemolyticus]|nr:hypothetical protein [Vibrio parahaemolyticus]